MAIKRTKQNYYLSKGRRFVKTLFKKVFEIQNVPRRVKTSSFIFDFNKYARLRKAKHEQLTGMMESDYGSVKINWDLFGDIKKKKQVNSEFNMEIKIKDRAIQSTYFPNRQSRIEW